MRVIKPHSPIAWFVALNTFFKDQTFGSRVNTPVLPMCGMKPMTSQLSDLIKTAAQEVKIQIIKQALYYIMALFHNTGHDRMNVFIQK